MIDGEKEIGISLDMLQPIDAELVVVEEATNFFENLAAQEGMQLVWQCQCQFTLLQVRMTHRIL